MERKRKMGRRFPWILALCLAPTSALAEEPAAYSSLAYEHLILSGGGESSSSTPGLAWDVGAGLPLGDEGLKAFLALRLGMDPDRESRAATHLFLRSEAGSDEWKTFVDAGLLTRLLPSWSAGARIGVGIQHEISDALSLFLSTGGSAGFGSRFQVGFDAGLGLQVRFGPRRPRPAHWYDY